MKHNGTANIQNITDLLNRLYPPGLAEEWDNVGLQVGDPQQEVRQAMVALDPSIQTVEAAIKSGCQALITHHPLIFHPLKKVVLNDEIGRTLFKAVQNHLAVIIAHTNLDRARDGLNDWLAFRLGVMRGKPLEIKKTELLKLVVYVPNDFVENVGDALFAAGAGQVGEYDQCSFRIHGEGTFRPGSGTNPYKGTIGQRQQVAEVRFETIVPRENLQRVIHKLLRVHPYEEVAYDLLPLDNPRLDLGLGRIGYLDAETTLEAFATQTKKSLEVPTLRIVGDLDKVIKKVALCAGSGAALLTEAVRQGADLFITGDLKYHEARTAEAQGLAVIDAGHFHTEKWVVPNLAARLRTEAKKLKFEIMFLEMNQEQDPFKNI